MDSRIDYNVHAEWALFIEMYTSLLFGWSIGLSNFQKYGGKLHFYAPIIAIVIWMPDAKRGWRDCDSHLICRFCHLFATQFENWWKTFAHFLAQSYLLRLFFLGGRNKHVWSLTTILVTLWLDKKVCLPLTIIKQLFSWVCLFSHLTDLCNASECILQKNVFYFLLVF